MTCTCPHVLLRFRLVMPVMLGVVALLHAVVPNEVRAQARAAARLPSIEERTTGFQKMDGLFPMYWDEAGGRLWLEIPRLGTEVLYVTGLGAGLGSNDIGLDRGALHDSRIVFFERSGPKVMLVQPNYEFRAQSNNPQEVKAVRDAFARSVLWGFTAAAETSGRVLVDATEFLLRDPSGISARLRPGSYRLEASRSSVYLPMTKSFPKNTELEAELTFVQQPGAAGAGAGGGEFFEGVGSVAATAEAASLRVHHSLVELPDNGYKPRPFDPRSGYGAHSWRNYAAPISQPITQRFIRRHRLEKVNPAARVSDAVKPIVYYLDAGTPEPIRSALLDGARWWNQAFEAAGYRNAFRVELLPDSVSPLDIRYNVINWVHRSTRGWSSGATVEDPRTGEILKAVVTLGSLRIRQDYMIAEGLLAPYVTGNEAAPELEAWGLARIRQLAAHEVGHTLGLGHNYYDSEAGRISVMDYPHPLVTLAGNRLDYAQVYEKGIGEWDSVAIAWGYQDFAEGGNETAALAKILDDAWQRDIRYMTNQDIAVNPRVDQWSHGTNAAAELDRMMEVRRFALNRFGEQAIRPNVPLAQMEEVLVPLYLHHRYQVEAAASTLGGQHYIYALRGDGRQPFRRAAATEQREALRALLATLKPTELALPRALIDRLPPRPPGYGRTRELFPRTTGGAFDAVAPAAVAAQHTLANLLDGARAARLEQQHALDPALPGLAEVLDNLTTAVFNVTTANPYEAQIARAVQQLAMDEIMNLAGTATMPEVRAIANQRLAIASARLASEAAGYDADSAYRGMLALDIKRFFERPGQPYTRLAPAVAPPGAPIGDPDLDWTSLFEPFCRWNW